MISEVFDFVVDSIKKIWSLSLTNYVLGFALTLRVFDAYIVPAIRKLTGKD